MEGHSIAGPECYEGSELVSELGDGADKTTSQLCGRAFGDVEICGNVDAAESQSTG